MVKTKLTPRATQTDKTEKFILAVDKAMETFEEEISSLSESTHGNAYKNFITLYRVARGPIWNLLRFAKVKTVLDTIVDKQFSELAVMKCKLCKKPPKATVVKEGSENSHIGGLHRDSEKEVPQEKLT